MKQVIASIISSEEVMPGAYLMWLESPYIAVAAKPGQFVMVRCGEESVLRRPLSIHQTYKKDRFALLFNAVGKGTHWLSQRQAGETIDLVGPMGNSFSVNPSSKNLLLVAGGIGTAPLLFLAQEALHQGSSVTMLLGASTASQLYHATFLPHEVKLTTATEDGTAGKKGMITSILPDFLDSADQVFACGPLPMYKTMAQMPALKGKPVQVSL